MNYPQYRKARRLTRECCNNVGGNCLLLDDGEECICAPKKCAVARRPNGSGKDTIGLRI